MGIQSPSKLKVIVAILTGVCFLGFFTVKHWLHEEYVIEFSQLPSPGRQNPYDTKLTLYQLPISKIKKKSVHGSILNYLADYKNPCWFEDNMTQLGLRCLPYFIQLGVSKCGSTSLFKQLVKHPDIAEPKRKELFFWGTPNQYVNLAKYLANFERASMEIFDGKDTSGYHHKITFEATPAYFSGTGSWTSVPGNNLGNNEPKYTMAHTLYSAYPNMRFIVIMRNPIDRLFSYYHHFHKKKFGAQDFHDHVVAGIQMMKQCLTHRTLRSCIYDHNLNSRIKQGGRISLHLGMYHPYAKEWLSVFPRHQMLFIKSEDFYTNSTSVVREAFNFLGLAEPSWRVIQSIDEVEEDMIKHYTEINTIGVNHSINTSYRTTMFAKTREILDDFYKPYNEKLAEFLGSDKFLFK